MKISSPLSNFPFKNTLFTSYILAIQSYNSISTSTILIVVLFSTGAALDDGLKCFPAICLNPLALSQPQYVPLLFLLDAHVDVMTFAPTGKSFCSKDFHTACITILFFSLLTSSFNLLLFGLFIASLNFITFNSPV